MVGAGPGGDAAGQPDRNGAADGVRRIEAEIGPRVLVQHAGDADLGVAVGAGFAIFQARRRAADLDIALERKALVVGADVQHRRFHLLRHDHVLGGEVRGVDGDRVAGRSGRQVGFERHAELDLRRHGAAGGRRIERHARRGVAQPVHRQQFGGGRHRPVELETHPRRRRVRRRIGHFELPRRHDELAAGRQIGGRLVDRDDRVAADHVHVEVGVVQGRQAFHRRQHAVGGQRIDRQSTIRYRRPALLKRLERRIHRDRHALDGAARQVVDEPVAHLGRDKDRPEPLQGIDRHGGRGKARGDVKLTAGIVGIARHADADLGVADIAAVIDDKTPLDRIERAAERDMVEHQRVARRVGRVEHDRTAADLEQPGGARGRRGRLDFRHQGDAVAAGNDVERRR